MNYINKFRGKYMDVLLDKECIDALTIILDDYNKNPPSMGCQTYIGPSLIKFLCWIGEYSDDNQRIIILKYIVDNYPKELEERECDIYDYIINECYSSEAAIECIELLSDEKYEWIHQQFRLKNHKRYIFKKYLRLY